MKIIRIVLGALLLCSPYTVGAKEHINIYAGAGMMNAVNELIEAYQQNSDVEIKPVYASSSTNARQIELGAPADIYISANRKWMDYLINKGIISEKNASVVANNELVLIAPSSVNIERFELRDERAWRENLKGGRLAIGEPNSVPVGIYAKQSLKFYNVWDDLKSKTVQTKTVRSALLMVERGEAEMGVVFRSDAFNNDKVTVLSTFLSESHKPIEFMMAQVGSDSESKKFVDFIRSKSGMRIWSKYGFL